MSGASGAAAWVWQDLPPGELRERWQRLTGWVHWLEEAFAPWVVLPPCWPEHESLRVELTMLWCWHDALRGEAADPADGIRWHAAVRSAAQAWQQLATCDHRAAGPEQQRVREAHRTIRDRFVADAMRDSSTRHPRPPPR